MPTLAEAIDRVIVANTAYRKRRALSKPERTLETAMRKAFAAEGKAFVDRLGLIWPRMLSEVRVFAGMLPWEPLFDAVALETEALFTAPIDTAAATALESGMAAAVTDLNLAISFDLKHPRAVEYMRDHGLTQVGRIRATTRETLRAILVEAADNGWSYNRTAKAIKKRYRHFSRERARNIAVYELGDVYSEGTMIVARDLAYGGLIMVKKWLSAGDAKVRPDHRANEDQGWIPLEDEFQSGSLRPPSDPRCRCTLLTQRSQDT